MRRVSAGMAAVCRCAADSREAALPVQRGPVALKDERRTVWPQHKSSTRKAQEKSKAEMKASKR